MGHGGAQTPEELETLLEDALLVRDQQMLQELFTPDAACSAHTGRPVRGAAAGACWALARWHGATSYVADPQAVIQAGGIALILSSDAVNVACRDPHGIWRYAIVHICPAAARSALQHEHDRVHETEQ